VKKALVDKGLHDTMFATEGVGASDQLVPDSNLAYSWQNHRVVFFAEKWSAVLVQREKGHLSLRICGGPLLP
jgi:hypothetical protein